MPPEEARGAVGDPCSPGAPTPATSQIRVLVIEDEIDTAAYMSDRLGAAGCRVDTVDNGTDGLERARLDAYDVIIVDRMLPGLDGLSLVARLRERGVDTPVLFVTALGTVADRVAGLEGGGDDYLVKPFSFAELNARVHALARRRGGGNGGGTPPRERTVLQVDDLVMDRLAREVRHAGQPVPLLSLEYRLLEYLMLHVGQVVTRAMLLEQVWGFTFDPRTNIVETHLSRLRAKLEQAGLPAPIRTIRGAGYVIGRI